MTQTELAAKMGVSIQRVNTLIAGKRGITAETAILLSRIFETSAELWMNLQNAVDLYVAYSSPSLERTRVHSHPVVRTAQGPVRASFATLL